MGSGILILGKIIGLNWLFSGQPEYKEIADLGNFKVANSGNCLDFFNKGGEKIFVLHKDGTLEVWVYSQTS